MEALLGNSIWVFLWLTLILHGGASLVTGQAVAKTWRPWWQAVLYGALLAGSARFLDFALFGGALLSVPAYFVAAAALIMIALIAYRYTRVDKLVRQYPWIYKKDGFGFVAALVPHMKSNERSMKP